MLKTAKVIKGFLICVSANQRTDSLANDFPNQAKWQTATLLYDEDYSKNTIFDLTESGFSIYIGDRHLNCDHAKFIKEIEQQGLDSFVGARIKYVQKTNSIEILSDFLGSESIYYYLVNNSLYISDRLENFSRYFTVTKSEPELYTSILMGATVANSTLLQGVKQTRPLQRVSFKVENTSLRVEEGKLWESEPDADVKSLYRQIDERLYSVLQQSPPTTLMLSAGWDSRVLMTSKQRIRGTYTHGDVSSREIKIAFKLGSKLSVPMDFVPLEESLYGAEISYEMLARLGQCYFPHWYYASKKLSQSSAYPLSAGLMVEHFSGHYGINSLPGAGRNIRLFNSMLAPQKYDKISNDEAIAYLASPLSKGFSSTPWFFKDDIGFDSVQKTFTEQTRQCLEGYVQTGTSGIQELCERYKIEHSLRQYFSFQTKSASSSLGYHHPFIDSQLAKLVLTLKYRHRINYKLSRHVVKSRAPHLLDLPLAATLAKASSPVVVQEASRALRIAGEKFYSKATGNLPKGLGWNNFQFLNKTNTFHEYADMLVDDVWDKAKIHKFITDYCKGDNEAYSLLILLTKMVSADYKIHPARYLKAN